MEANAVDHMSMWSLISNASLVVQLVMLTLVAASVTSWVMIFQRTALLRAAKRALDNFEERFWSGIDLSKLYRQAGSNPDPDSGVEQIFRAGALVVLLHPAVENRKNLHSAPHVQAAIHAQVS